MEDDGPNFSYAYGGSVQASSTSWNPALRPDNVEPASNARAAHLQPSPQIIPQSKPELEESQDDDDLEAEVPGLSASAETVDKDSDAHLRESHLADPSQPSSALHPNGASERPGHHDVDTWPKERDSDLGWPQAHSSSNGAYGAEMETRKRSLSMETSDMVDESQNYEHQTEDTVLDDAIQESAKAPLLSPGEADADDWESSGEVFDLGGKPQEAPLQSPATPLPADLDAFQSNRPTNVGDEAIGDSTIGGNTGADLDWGTADGDDFFQGAGGFAPPAGPTAATSIAQPVDEQLAAASSSLWDLSLDDDFLPEGEEVPQFDMDDDDGFLEEEPLASNGSTLLPASDKPNATSRYAPQTAPIPPAQFNQLGNGTYNAAPQALPVAPNVGPYGAYAPSNALQQQPARPALPSSTQSFADKAKGGYASPYDLPDDVVTTRKRAAPRTATTSAIQHTAPPPRSSSVPDPTARPPVSSIMSTPSLPATSRGLPSSATSQPSTLTRTQSNDFFAELPVSQRPRTAGRYAPQTGAHQQAAPQPGVPKERTASWSSLRNEVRAEPDLVSRLQQPERLPVFPDQPTAPVRSNSLPVPAGPAAATSNRYSPAPSLTGTSPGARPPPAAPGASSRYSPAPQSAQTAQHPPSAPPAGFPRPPTQPYAPRTSSPLAYHNSPALSQGDDAVARDQSGQGRTGHDARAFEASAHHAQRPYLEDVNEMDEPAGLPRDPAAATRSATPPQRSNPGSAVSSPRKRSNYMPRASPQDTATALGAPLQRSQSPLQQTTAGDPRTAGFSFASALPHVAAGIAAQNLNSIPQRHQPSHDYEYIAPSDERAADPLQRWRGHPIVTWGLGGTIVTTFPKQIPRYGGGATAPMIKCSPGEVKIQSFKTILAAPGTESRFPGPLKAKSKKKDVITWLGERIASFEQQRQDPLVAAQSLSAEDVKRSGERIVLWKVLQLFIENDGNLSGKPEINAAVTRILSPNAASHTARQPSLSTAADLLGQGAVPAASAQADAVSAGALEDIRAFLASGEREKAVWHAVDQRLWAHAMLLSSTLSKDVWKQVVQEFVKKEVKKVGRDNQSLAVLYEIFAGNHEDCIDELVPASARAGFQMMSVDRAGGVQNGLDGLDKWRETLALVLNNRSEGDDAALLSLARLLAGYGRIEAAHTCLLFARAVAAFGGVDDSNSDVVLLGVDHRQPSLELGVDLDPIYLTEIYEFGLSLAATGGSHVIPHLQGYKLAHAYRLAECGQRADAQAYCDVIATAMKATTRVSPYYNASFVTSLDDLGKRLSQSPKDGSSSWISKPSMDKVSSSLLSKFNSFIAGDEDDAASTHSGAEVGPFAKIAGNTPTISPVQSSADLYGSYGGYTSAQPTATNSRYAPVNTQASRTSLESNQSRSQYDPQGRPSLESTGSAPGFRSISDSYTPSPSLSGPYTPSQAQVSPPVPQLGKSQSYSPLRTDNTTGSYGSPYLPTPPATEIASPFAGYHPNQASFDDPPSASVANQEPHHGFDSENISTAAAYEPPTSSYEPPSYAPYQPDVEDDADERPKPKKKSFMDDDDDDDLAGRAAAMNSKSKADKDREADEAFRRAAEADAQRDKDAAAAKKAGGSGWFGGWFKKDPNAPAGPIKAKLGEENSFYYDPDLGKWVNKKAGAADATPKATPTPPPQRGPPSRNASAMGPPSSLPNSAGHLNAPPSRPPTSAPQRSTSMPPPTAVPDSRASTPGLPSDTEAAPKPPVLTRPALSTTGGPPSRPGTGLSTASSIDDLIGAPQARKGSGTVKKKKGGRYIDVMAK